MERKYYLRGLGIGIAVTAIIMGIALSGDRTMTDGEIIARAKELGMVENTVLSNQSDKEPTQEDADGAGADIQESAGDTNPNVQENVSGIEQDVAEEDGEAVDDSAAVHDETDDGSSDDEEEQMPDVSDEDTEADSPKTPDDAETDDGTDDDASPVAFKAITINSGDGSYTVAKKLADVGVISSAENFDTFLCENGYDKRLHTGTFSIPTNASDEQIARIVTGAE